jgi:two-component system, NarL family, nitrate/nitrite response regulator NarL
VKSARGRTRPPRWSGPGPGAAQLTSRECEIVRQVAVGRRNAEVARALGISEETVKKHLNNVFRKLRLRARVQVALYALQTGLVALARRRH